MKRLCILSLVAVLLSNASMSTAKPVDDELCRQIPFQFLKLATAELVGRPILTQARGGDDRCEIQNVAFKSSSFAGMTFEAASIIVEAEELAEHAAFERIPGSFSVSIKGLIAYVQIDDSAFDYAARARAMRNPMSLDVALIEDTETEMLRVKRAELNLGDGNYISATGLVSSFTLDGGNQSWIENLATAKVEETSLTLEFNGMFENYILAMLAARVITPDSSTPDVEFELAQERWIDYAQNLPEPQFQSESRTALIRFLESLPHPTGTLSIGVVFNGGFGMREAQTLGAKQFENPFSDELADAAYRVEFEPKEP